MSETMEEGRPGRRSSSGPGFGRARGRGRSRGRGLLGIPQQQRRVPGRQLTTPQSNQSNDVPEDTTLNQDQFQDSPKPGILTPSQNDNPTVEGSTHESALSSSTTQDCQATAMVSLTKSVEEIKSPKNPKVVIYMSSVSSEIMKEDIEGYFEAQGDDIQVESVQLLKAERKAVVVLVGITAKELTRLQDKKHKIRKKEVFIDIGHSVASNTVLETHGGLDTVEVSGIPAQVVEHDLKFYFETQTKCGEGDEVVKEIKIMRPGVAHIQFISPEVAGCVVSKEVHKIFRTQIRVKLIDSPHVYSAMQAYETEEPDLEGEYESNKLLIRNIPDGVDKGYLHLFVYKQLGVSEKECSVTLHENKAEIQFDKWHTIDGEFIVGR